MIKIQIGEQKFEENQKGKIQFNLNFIFNVHFSNFNMVLIFNFNFSLNLCDITYRIGEKAPDAIYVEAPLNPVDEF